MITENLSTLKIHKLTQEQYDRELAAGNIEHNALYLTTDDRNYTDTDIDTKLDGKSDISHNHDTLYDTKGSAANALAEAKTYADTKTSSLASTTVVDSKINSHNTSTIAHNDIRGEIDALQEAVNGKAASSHSHTITATAIDDDVIVLTGTNGDNQVTFDAKHATSGVTAGEYRNVTVNAYGHVTGGSNPTSLSGYGIEDAYTKTEVNNLVGTKANSSHSHSNATTSAAGFMTADMVTKLNGIATGATKVTVDSDLSTSSTNPVRNSAVTTAINSATIAIANLQTTVNEFEEITSAEISNLFSA